MTRSPLPRVTLVGAGPGDPELLTIKAVRAIRSATVLLVDDLVGEQVLRYARRSTRIGARPCSSPKRAWSRMRSRARARRARIP